MMDYREHIYRSRIEENSRHKLYLTSDVTPDRINNLANRLYDAGRDEKVFLYVDSPGGSAIDGLAFGMLCEEHGNVHARLGNQCSSSAALIAIGCHEIVDGSYNIRHGRKTEMLIHDVGLAERTGETLRADDMRFWATQCDELTDAAVDWMARRTGNSAATIRQMANANTMLRGDDIRNRGFATGPKPWY